MIILHNGFVKENSGYYSKLAVDWSNRRRLLREEAFSGDPTGVAEEAPQTPRGKRSLVRNSTAVFNRVYIIKVQLIVTTIQAKGD
ncbi:hypothetical protein JOC95_002460 [Bacillus tianshenii]|uniref:Uncharacterized protein n=1 Tax=Sutcliffiella tianshenii TaxID=1463404 RepID=A0ABS2P0X0_9BACI|nr:hypothetical protein [Bacillus tianshenii]